jgi:hypothetical protein
MRERGARRLLSWAADNGYELTSAQQQQAMVSFAARRPREWAAVQAIHEDVGDDSLSDALAACFQLHVCSTFSGLRPARDFSRHAYEQSSDDGGGPQHIGHDFTLVSRKRQGKRGGVAAEQGRSAASRRSPRLAQSHRAKDWWVSGPQRHGSSSSSSGSGGGDDSSALALLPTPLAGIGRESRRCGTQ